METATFDLSHTNDPKDPIGNMINAIIHVKIMALAKAFDLPEDNSSLGWTLANFHHSDNYDDPTVWNDPTKLVMLSGGYGDQQLGLAANAACKMRAAARTGRSTLELRATDIGAFWESTTNQADKTENFTWLDFPYGGAVVISDGGVTWIGAVSGWNQHEDTFGAAMICGAASMVYSTIREKALAANS